MTREYNNKYIYNKQQIEQHIKRLESENELLKTHIQYRPNGLGYIATKNEFESLVKNE